MKRNSKGNTLISAGVKLEGNITGNGILRLYGEVEGNIDIGGEVIVGETGKVTGNITGQKVVLGGMVSGDVEAREQLRLVSGGRLLGNIKTKSLIIDENASFRGTSQMADGLFDPRELEEE